MLNVERNMVKPSKEAIFTGSQEGVLREMIRSVKDKDFNRNCLESSSQRQEVER